MDNSLSTTDSIDPKPFTPEMKTRVFDLLEKHESELREYTSLLLTFNKQLNLISRRSAERVFEDHVLHCLTLLAKPFLPGSVLADFGTGGGLPAIPLSICAPDIEIVAIDRTAKKIRAVQKMSESLQLTNMNVWNGSVEEWRGKNTYSVSRATAPLKSLWKWHKNTRHTDSGGRASCWKPGLVCLKGGDLSEEIRAVLAFQPDVSIDVFDLNSFDDVPYFDQKVLIHLYL